MQNHRTMWIPMILAAVMPMTACLDDEPTGPKDGMASLSVFLTDAPGDVNRVWVELLSITAQGGEGGPVELLDAPTDLILLTDLVGTVQPLTLNAEFYPTTIRQLRLVVGDAVLESLEGTVYVKGDPELPAVVKDAKDIGELHCPSCSQSGIKVKIPNDEMEVEEGAAALVLDFVVAQSFGHTAGNSGKWIMHPVIHGTLVEDQDGDGAVLEELGAVSAISGTVALGTDVSIPECPAGTARTIKDFIPTATVIGMLDGEGQPIVRSGPVDEGGAFHIGFVPSLSYTMGYVGTLTLGTDQLTFTATVDPAQVTVSGAEVTGVAYTIQSAQCQPVG